MLIKLTVRCFWSFLLIIIFFLGGCTGTRLAGLQVDFERLYLARLKIEQEQDKGVSREGWSGTEDIEIALQGISLEARKAARQANVDDNTRIAFLRLAMIAAWQGKQGDTKYVNGIIDASKDLCGKLPQESPTRDCALFLIIPGAIASSRIPPARKLNKAFNNHNNKKIPKDLGPEAKKYFDNMKTIIKDTLHKYVNSGLPEYLKGHERLFDYYKEELERYRGRLKNARVYATHVDGDQASVTSVINSSDQSFAICAENWIVDINQTQELNPQIKNQAKKCLNMLAP